MTKLNQQIIKLQKNQQSAYKLIYSLCLIELKIAKTYIKTNLVNGFIQPSKSPANALIFFFRKPNSSLKLYVNY